jgi:hypothetical protein
MTGIEIRLGNVMCMNGLIAEGLNDLNEPGPHCLLSNIKGQCLQWDFFIKAGDSSLVHEAEERGGGPGLACPNCAYNWAIREITLR